MLSIDNNNLELMTSTDDMTILTRVMESVAKPELEKRKSEYWIK